MSRITVYQQKCFRVPYSFLSQKNHILIEKDNRKTIKKIFQYSENATEILHRMSNKHSLVLAHYLFDKIISDYSTASHVRDICKKVKSNVQISKSDLAIYDDIVNSQINNTRTFRELVFIVDWITGRNQQINPVEPRNLKLNQLSFADAYRYAEQWHDYLKKGAGAAVNTGKIIIQYADGYYWVDLESRKCGIEAIAGGHCGKGEFGAESNLYSLRSPQHTITLTADINKKTKDLRQLRGRGNSKPKDKYHKYIVDFLTNKKIGIKKISLRKAWKPSQNFRLKDLSESDYKKVILNHPDWETQQIISFNELFDVYDVSYIYRPALTKFIHYCGYLIDEVEEIRVNEIEFNDGKIFKFYTEEDAETYIKNYMENSTYLLFQEDEQWRNYIDEGQLADFLIERDTDHWRENAYANPGDYLNEEPEGKNGKWTNAQIEEAQNNSMEQGEENVNKDPIQYAINNHYATEDCLISLIDIETWIDDEINYYGYDYLSHYDGSYEEIDDIIFVRD